ncbi:MAG: hypothetical protein VKM92_05300, partial [Cyanobacteriota bacterium]|nr:hypothetical protein [Cyanobacteriota bacterium]
MGGIGAKIAWRSLPLFGAGVMGQLLNAAGKGARALMGAATAATTVCICLGLPAAKALADPAASFVLLNGSVYTVNAKQPWAQAVAVQGDRIVYVGSNTGARAFIGKGSRA